MGRGSLVGQGGGGASGGVPEDVWTDVERYVAALLLPDDPALEAALRDAEAGGLPAIQVAPPEGRFLHLLVRMLGARTVLEIGTLGGYSAICMARALPPGGRLVSLELKPDYAALARASVERAGLGDVVEIRVGPASESLARLAAEQAGPFDLVFIDADKRSTPEYFDMALRMSRPGSVIVVDNVVRSGALLDAGGDDPDIEGMRRFLERVASEPRVAATVLQTVGSKGYDGFAVVRVES